MRLDDFIIEAINADEFDRLPWQMTAIATKERNEAQAEAARLTEWVRHLVERNPRVPDLPTLLEAAGWERRGAVGTHATWIEP